MSKEIQVQVNNPGAHVSNPGAQDLDSKLLELVKSTSKGLVFAEQEMSVFSLIESYLTPEKLQQLRKLENKQYGFKVAYGKDIKSLSEETFKNCMIEALRRGLLPTGNEFNVISGNVYTTLEGCKSLLRKMEVSLIKEVFPLSYLDPLGRVIIEPTIEWEWKGSKGVFFPGKLVIESKDNPSEDFRRGKAKRKSYAGLIEHLTGRNIQTVDEDGVTVEVTPQETQNQNNEHVTKDDSQYISEMISNEYQQKFDSYISKAKNETELLDMAKKWCGSKVAKDDLRIVYEIVDGLFKTENIDLGFYNSMIEKFKVG